MTAFLDALVTAARVLCGLVLLVATSALGIDLDCPAHRAPRGAQPRSRRHLSRVDSDLGARNEDSNRGGS
jgi:hypothetical protein